MKLSVIERISVQGLLPDRGTYTNLKLLRVAREALSFTEKENKVLKFRIEGEKTHWESNVLIDKETKQPIKGSREIVMRIVNNNPDKFEMVPTVDEVDIKLGGVVTKMIAEALRKLETTEKLEERHFSLYEKFVVKKRQLKQID